jgi:hypothetical protein
MRHPPSHAMPTPRDPSKLEPAYLITLAVIVGLPICCSVLNRGVPPPEAPKMSVPNAGTWTVTMKDDTGAAATSSMAVNGGKWRFESRPAGTGQTLVVVHDGTHSASNTAMPPEQREMLSPLKQLAAIAFAYDRHPKPEYQSLDGALCWHASLREGDHEAEAWLDAKTRFPRKFQTRRPNGRTISYEFQRFSPEAPNDTRIFDTNIVEPLLNKN